LEIHAYREEDCERVVELWHETQLDAYPYLPLTQSYERDDHLRFFHERIAPSCEIWLAEDERGLMGFLALNGSYVDRLYIHPTRQRVGAGTALLRKAMQLSPNGLELHTHQENESACAFYEKHGFAAVKYGISPAPESAPDVEYHWRPGSRV
jgi:ribosomal protein S18 acetylase RimI-like enzyme